MIVCFFLWYLDVAGFEPSSVSAIDFASFFWSSMVG
jgi:hypothetical protein